MALERVVFVHGAGSSGAVAWPRQQGLSLDVDCLYVYRHGCSADPREDPGTPASSIRPSSSVSRPTSQPSSRPRPGIR